MEKTEYSLFAKALNGNSSVGRMGSVFASMAVSFAIFFGIVQVQKTKTEHNVITFDEIETVILPSPPVPPPRFEEAEQPPPPSLLNMQPNASESTIEIAYNPDSNFVPIKPQAEFNADFDLEVFKPSLENSRSKRVYNKRDVDQAPIAVYKKRPKFDPQLLSSVDFRRVKIMYIVNTDGSVENVNLLHSDSADFDRLMMTAAKTWRFKPAIKDGQSVRCWVKQAVTLKQGSGSPYHVN